VNTGLANLPFVTEVVFMKNKTLVMKYVKTGMFAGALIVGSLAASTAWAQDVHVGVNIPAPNLNVQIGVPDDYVYYPKYGAYYSPSHHRYYYQDHGSWSWHDRPVGVAPDVFLKAPSVKMNFHDAPDRHHADIARQYPKDWAPRHDEHPGR
jgi:hypothetical protein